MLNSLKQQFLKGFLRKSNRWEPAKRPLMLLLDLPDALQEKILQFYEGDADIIFSEDSPLLFNRPKEPLLLVMAAEEDENLSSFNRFKRPLRVFILEAETPYAGMVDFLLDERISLLTIQRKEIIFELAYYISKKKVKEMKAAAMNTSQ
jgi:hypothetical protein